MKTTAYIAIMLFLMPGICPTASAEWIEHHGHPVEPEGTLKDCMSCHDGSKASKVLFCTSDCGPYSSSHSVLKRYPPKRNREKYASLEEVTAKGVKIVDGRITCISCHNLRNPGKKHLVIDEKGRYCSICHIINMRHPPLQR